MLQLWARVDLGTMPIKGYSAFLKVPALLEPHHHIVSCQNKDVHEGSLILLQRKTLRYKWCFYSEVILYLEVRQSCSLYIYIYIFFKFRKSFFFCMCVYEWGGVTIRLFSVISNDTRWASLTPLQRYSRCILHPQPTEPMIIWHNANVI